MRAYLSGLTRRHVSDGSPAPPARGPARIRSARSPPRGR
jgi:hypothetical protein